MNKIKILVIFLIITFNNLSIPILEKVKLNLLENKKIDISFVCKKTKEENEIIFFYNDDNKNKYSVNGLLDKKTNYPFGEWTVNINGENVIKECFVFSQEKQPKLKYHYFEKDGNIYLKVENFSFYKESDRIIIEEYDVEQKIILYDKKLKTKIDKYIKGVRYITYKKENLKWVKKEDYISGPPMRETPTYILREPLIINYITQINR